ncbi:T9SS type A sorting domain-containing protein, partial [Saccharicrinis fermentans]|uniref:T9SS type A sorting domain-containing protein n=1 Tax=Saccharicrinis fermentans TaxID=982 RepID=UPI0005C6E076
PTTSYFDTIYNKLSNADLIEENVFPIAEAGLDQTIMCSDSIEDVIITLDGSESNDSDGFIRSYVWSENEKILATGVNSTVELKVGVHEIVLLVTDNEGGTASDTMIVNIKLADDLTTYYYLENKGSRNMRLKVQNSVNGSALLMCPESTEGWEAQWEKVTSGNYFYFKNRWTGMSFQPESAEDGSIIIQQDKITEEEWAQWSEDISNEGYFYLRNRKTNKYIRPINGENNSPIELRPSSYKGDYTKWRFVAVESSLKNGIKDENIEENIKDLFVIYPNPAMDNLNVKFSLKQEDQVTIEIYNTSGQKFIVKQLGWLDRGGCNINLKVGNAVNMCPGIYCVMIKTSKTRVSRYVVIK